LGVGFASQKQAVLVFERRDGKKEIEPPHINELHVVFGMFRDFLPSRLEMDAAEPPRKPLRCFLFSR
jgi:hypothetical protein